MVKQFHGGLNTIFESIQKRGDVNEVEYNDTESERW